jgi:hypothetical protein
MYHFLLLLRILLMLVFLFGLSPVLLSQAAPQLVALLAELLQLVLPVVFVRWDYR